MPFPVDRTAAIEHHFRKREFVWSEGFFLSVLREPRSKFDVAYSAIGLRRVGSLRAIPALVELLAYPMQDVKCAAILTIAHLGRASVTPILADALLNPNYREKSYAMWAIMDAADERAIPAVLSYFAKNQAKLRAGKLDALGYGARYLAKFMNSNSDARVFVKEIPKFWSRIPKRMQEEIKEHIPELASQIEIGSD